MAKSGKKILMIIAPENFRDEEFIIPYKKFLANQIEVEVVSLRKGEAKGMFGASFNVKKTVYEIKEFNYNAIVFVGGQGTPLLRADARAVEIAKNGVKNDVLAAICWAPTILAKAGVLVGKKATVWLGNDAEYNLSTDKVMKKFGAVFVNKDVATDGNIVTGNGPNAAEKFADAIVEKLLNRQKI